jgi:hypothetical protein
MANLATVKEVVRELKNYFADCLEAGNFPMEVGIKPEEVIIGLREPNIGFTEYIIDPVDMISFAYMLPSLTSLP